MAKEITMSGRLVFDDGKTSVTFDKGVIKVDSADKRVIQSVQEITGVTSMPTPIDKGDVGTVGVAMFQNLDLSQTITLSISGTDIIVLLPGEFAGPLRLAADPSANTANAKTAKLEYIIVEE